MRDALRPVLVSVTALLLSLALLSFANGLQGTLLGVEATGSGFRQLMIGLMMSGFFAGYIAGTLACPRLLSRIGHIRTFAALAAVTSAATLAHVLVRSEWSWTAIRTVSGFGYAGLIMSAESWLNARGTRTIRGSLLAVYGMVMTGSWAFSQLFLQFGGGTGGLLLFCAIAMAMSLAVVPVSLTRFTAPRTEGAAMMPPHKLLGISHIATFGSVVTGMCMAALWGLGPSYARLLGLDHAGIAHFMAMAMLGPLVLHWPVGWLSDWLDRPKVLLAAAGLAGAASLALSALGDLWAGGMLALAFLYGGLTLPVYSLSLAHFNDNIEEAHIIPVGSGAVLLYGSGAMLGPLGAGQVMAWVGPRGLFLFTGTVLMAYVAYSAYRLAFFRRTTPAGQGAFVALPPQHTAASAALVPREAEPAAPEPGVPPAAAAEAGPPARRAAGE